MSHPRHHLCLRSPLSRSDHFLDLLGQYRRKAPLYFANFGIYRYRCLFLCPSPTRSSIASRPFVVLANRKEEPELRQQSIVRSSSSVTLVWTSPSPQSSSAPAVVFVARVCGIFTLWVVLAPFHTSLANQRVRDRAQRSSLARTTAPTSNVSHKQ